MSYAQDHEELIREWNGLRGRRLGLDQQYLTTFGACTLDEAWQQEVQDVEERLAIIELALGANEHLMLWGEE